MKLNNFLEFFLLHKHFNAEIHEGQYDQLDQEIISGNENVKIQQSDLVIISYNLQHFFVVLKNIEKIFTKPLTTTNN